jgi:hypothetical protein
MNRSLPIALAACLALSASTTVAHAALTVSEQAQIKSFVAEARPASALRVRAMVARPDLSADESASALRDAVAPVAFTEARAVYLRELLFGPASAPSRPMLSIAVTRAVLARADEVLTRAGGDLEAPASAASLAELSRIYAFLDAELANAGRGTGAARETSAGITTTSYEECAMAIAAHVARHPRALRGDAVLGAALVPVRAELQLALLDMMNDTPTRKVDAAGRLGLAGPRRALLTELGLLLIDDGQADAARIDRVRAILSRLPGARADVEALYYGDAKPTLKARGAIVALKSPLEGTRAAAQAAAVFGDGDEVEGAAIDAPSAELARELATLAVKRALDARPELRAEADRDWKAAGGDPKKVLGVPDGGSLEATLAAAAQLLVLDAPRAIDLAMVRALAGRPESAALLADTLGALAAYAPATSTPSGIAVPLGRARKDGADGGSETVLATGLKLTPAGAVTSFTFQAHTWTFDRPGGAAPTVKRDGAPLTLAMLPGARVPVSEGAVWSSSGLVFAKMQGSPRAGIAPGPRVRLVGAGPRGYDAIATAAPGDDVLVEGDVTPAGPVALAVRAIAGKDAWKGVLLVLAPGVAGAPWRASIRSTDEAGKETELAPPVDLPAATPLHVKLVVRGSKLDATVGGVALKATVPPAYAHGDVALGARKGASLDVAGWSVRRP